MTTKYIFVTGGVVSSLGKGVAAASIGALLKARAAELGEARRRHVRLTAGYGDATNRDVMDDEARRAETRHRLLGALLEALRRAL